MTDIQAALAALPKMPEPLIEQLRDHCGAMSCTCGTLKRDAANKIEELQRRAEAAEQRVKDYEDDAAAVLAEQCAPDEKHCTCVPHLRKRIGQLQSAEQERFNLACEWRNTAERIKTERDAALQRAEAAERERDRLRKAIDVQAAAARTLQDTGRVLAAHDRAAAERARSESRPEALESERAINAKLTEELDAAQRKVEELRGLLEKTTPRMDRHDYVCASEHGLYRKKCDCGLLELRASVAAALGEKASSPEASPDWVPRSLYDAVLAQRDAAQRSLDEAQQHSRTCTAVGLEQEMELARIRRAVDELAGIVSGCDDMTAWQLAHGRVREALEGLKKALEGAR